MANFLLAVGRILLLKFASLFLFFRVPGFRSFLWLLLHYYYVTGHARVGDNMLVYKILSVQVVLLFFFGSLLFDRCYYHRGGVSEKLQRCVSSFVELIKYFFQAVGCDACCLTWSFRYFVWMNSWFFFGCGQNFLIKFLKPTFVNTTMLYCMTKWWHIWTGDVYYYAIIC